jgi:hypothetical protein
MRRCVVIIKIKQFISSYRHSWVLGGGLEAIGM